MSLLGLFVSEFVNNKIAAYTFPLLCVYVQDILMQRLLGWQRGAVISWKALGVNQLEMTLQDSNHQHFSSKYVVTYSLSVIVLIIRMEGESEWRMFKK